MLTTFVGTYVYFSGSFRRLLLFLLGKWWRFLFIGLHFHVVGEAVVRVRTARQERVYDRENYIDFRMRLLGEPGKHSPSLCKGGNWNCGVFPQDRDRRFYRLEYTVFLSNWVSLWGCHRRSWANMAGCSISVKPPSGSPTGSHTKTSRFLLLWTPLIWIWSQHH